jgi:uncharacterized OB-fold protein
MTIEDLLDAWPGVRIDHDNLAFYRGLLGQVLLLNRCDDCAHWHHPPRPVCPKCWSAAVTPTEVNGDGFVAIVTILRQGSRQPGVDYADGHSLVAIELDEQPGLRVSGTIVETAAADVAVGDRVRMIWRDIEGRPPRPDFEVVR